MRYAHIFCGWSKRLKPNESRRAFIRSAWLCFVASTSGSHAPRALFDEAIDRSASGSEIRIGIAVVVLLISLIGGRIIPSFTRNWLVAKILAACRYRSAGSTLSSWPSVRFLCCPG